MPMHGPGGPGGGPGRGPGRPGDIGGMGRHGGMGPRGHHAPPPQPPPRRGWGWGGGPRRTGCCMPGCLTIVLGAGGLVALLVMGLAALF